MPTLDDELLAAAATAHDLALRARAHRVVVLLDRGAGTAVLDWSAGGPMAVLEDGEEEAFALPEDLGGALPLLVTAAEPLPVLEVDVEAGEIVAPMGAVARTAAAVREVAEALPRRSVITAQFRTSDPGAPLAISARAQEPLVLMLGDEPFDMPAGWPGPA